MLLIVFLGLIAKLRLVSGNCEVGTSYIKDYNFTKVVGTWYVFLHTPNVVENDLDCVVNIVEPPVGNVSLLTVKAYINSTESYITAYGNSTNWDNTGVDIIFTPPVIWNGRLYVIATDYNRFCIHKICSSETNQTYTYVCYRSTCPGEDTEKDAMMELKKNNIDVSNLVKYNVNQCKKDKSSTEGKSSK